MFPDGTETQESVGSFLDGKFDAVLAGDAARQLLGQNPDGYQDLESCIVKNVERYMSAAASGAGDGQNSRSFKIRLITRICEEYQVIHYCMTMRQYLCM